MTEYFSDRELGSKERTVEEIDIKVWGGIYLTIQKRIEDGSFGYSFPEKCHDNKRDVSGYNPEQLALAIQAEIPNLIWELNHQHIPDIYDMLDLIEFVYKNIGYPIELNYHSYWNHHHLSFDVEKGKLLFRDDINLIFKRNGIAFEL